jgi:hypothetical protein
MMSYLPREMRVDVRGYMLRLGAVYAEYDADMVIRAVQSYTGVQPHFYCVMDYESIAALIDVLGEVDYTVPEDMYYLPLPYDYDEENPDDYEEELEPEIDLKRGRQMLDGEKAVQLLRYRSYGGTYTADETGGVFRAGKTFLKQGQPKTVVNALAQNTAKMLLPFDEQYIFDTRFIQFDSGCKTGGAAANSKGVIFNNIPYRTFPVKRFEPCRIYSTSSGASLCSSIIALATRIWQYPP